MTSFTALLDACVLYPAPLRDLLLNLTCQGLFRARWTEEIHDEWIRNLLANRPDLKPDPDDRHVLAAAICGHAQGIVTFNERDFPSCSLAGFEIEVLHPDEFISHLISLLDWKSVCRALKLQSANLKNPPYSAGELLDTLERLKLPLTVSQLRPLEEFI